MTLDSHHCSKNNCSWNNYNTYRLVLLSWMMNEISITVAPVDMSHAGYYIHWTLYVIITIFVGIPIVYSEICLAQFTNGDAVSIWNFCPILRSFGYGTIYLAILKIIYMFVLTSWYLKYTFVATFDPPPWFTCAECNESVCMVKRVNVSIFQHCIESQLLFNQDCGMVTASNCYFQREIGNQNSRHTSCGCSWKTLLNTFILCGIFFVLSTKNEKLLKVIVRVLVVYVCSVLLILFCVALSASGTWYARMVGYNLRDLSLENSSYVQIQSFLACGLGSGVIGFISRNISFRSPATMTAVVTPLFSNFITILLSLILLGAIKTVSYFHGGESNILEEGDSIYFNAFASVAEILSYFDSLPLWSFIWFSTMFLCLLVNTSISCLFVLDFLTMNSNKARNHKNITCIIMLSLSCLLSCPFQCSDLTVVLTDVTEFIQLTNSFFFSLGIYWIYGFHKHNIDIIFMIGVKASYFWKIAWITNPIWILVFIYIKCTRLLVEDHDTSYIISFISMPLDLFLVYTLIGFYVFIIIIGILKELKYFYTHDTLRNLFVPLPNWGPQDKILLRSRKMFVPEIMTREFLYRQVKIHGYSRRKKIASENVTANIIEEQETSPEIAEWSALTSN